MPIPPRNPYLKFTCRACGWSIVIKQTSDVIIAPRTCQQCGGADLTKSQANWLEQLANLRFRR